MAPRQSKVKLPADDASTTPSPLKPKTEKAKVEKVKSDKPKAPKVTKPKVTKVKPVVPPTSDDEAMEDDEASIIKLPPRPKVTKAKPVSPTSDDEAMEDDDPPTIKAPPKPKATTAKKTTDKDASTARDTKGKDGKEKVKAVNGDEAIEVMMKYLKEQNRPYSATEISLNLHGKVTKTVADKLLKEMGANDLIMAKATNGTNKGSQWVFWAKQTPEDAASPEELAAMEASIVSIKESLPALKAEHKNATLKLSVLRSAPTTSQLVTMVDALREENKIKQEKLAGYTNGVVKTLTKDEIEKIEKDFKHWTSKRKARKNAYKSLESQLLDAGISKDQIEEKAGFEPDTYDT